MIGLNPNFDWTRYAGNALQDIGVGLTQAPTIAGGFARGAQINQAQQPYRDQQQTLEEQRKRDALEKNQTSEWIKANFPQYSNLPAAQGWQAAMADLAAQRAQGAPELLKGVEINGQLVNPVTGELMGDFRTPDGTQPKDAPSGYQWTPDGTLSFIPGGPADPSTNAKTTEATRRNQQLAKVLVPEAESLLGSNGKPGTFDSLSNGGNQFAGGINVFGARPLQGFTAADYQQAQNSIKTVVASYLYSVSGATATDDEVQRQTDVLTPKPFEAPESIAQKKARLQQMVEAVVEAANGTPTAAASGSGTTYTFNPATGELE